MPSVSKTGFFALADGTHASLYTLEAGGHRVSLSDMGAGIVSWLAPARGGAQVDIILGPAEARDYARNQQYFGATVGRFANRITGASFFLGGERYALEANDGANHLHGGPGGFSFRKWNARTWAEDGCAWAEFRLHSPDGEGGYPGAVDAVARYALSPDGELAIEHEAESDAPTPFSMTSHGYFNLDGSPDIRGHELFIRSDRFVQVDERLLPTGILESVEGTRLDFRKAGLLGSAVAQGGGIDCCYALDVPADDVPADDVPAATLFCAANGMALDLFTDMPGLQLYTGTFLAGCPGKNGTIYGAFAGLCLEPEYYPDSPNQPSFPSCILAPERPYRHTIRLRLRSET